MRSIKRSPVSMFFGSRLWRKLTALQGSSRGGGRWPQGAPEGGRGPVVWDGPADKAALPVDRGTLGAWLLRRGGHGGGAGLGGSWWSGPGRPGWTGFRQAATLVGAVALGNVAVIHGTHLPEKDLWAQLFAGRFLQGGIFFATWMARSSFSARSGRTKGFRAWKRASCRSSPPICLDICRKP